MGTRLEIVSNSRLRHLDQCSMPTVSHPTRFDTRPKCSRRPCTCSDICISSSAQPAKPGIHAGSQKYACSCQMQAGLPCTSPKPCNGPSIPPIEGITCIHAALQKFPYFLLELGGCSLGQKACMRGLAFSTGPRVGRGTIHDIPKMGWLARGGYAASPGCVPLLNCCMQDTNRG